MNGDLVDALPPSLKVVGLPHVGYDHYDYKAMAKKGIIVCNSPGMSANEVADIALHLVLSAYRQTTLFESSLRQLENTSMSKKAVLQFDSQTGQYPTSDLEPLDPNSYIFGHVIGNRTVRSPGGQRAGIAGFGAIGRALAKRLHALDMEIHYLKRAPLTSKELKLLEGIPLTRHNSFESLAKVSDVLILALPLTASTFHLVNDASICLLPDQARIVNVGRGPLIDQCALLRALKSGKLSGAGLDVFEQEPVVEPELLSRYDVTLLPHIAACTSEVANNSMINSLENIKNVLVDGGNGLHPVNI